MGVPFPIRWWRFDNGGAKVSIRWWRFDTFAPPFLTLMAFDTSAPRDLTLMATPQRHI